MDEEHRTLVGLINALDKEKDVFTKELLGTVLKTLEEYTRNHFAHEERMMNRMNFPDLDDHLEQHRKFESTVKMYVEKFCASNSYKILLDDTLQFLTKWLWDHIQVQDKRYSEFLVS